jgi:hypothetical protein
MHSVELGDKLGISVVRNSGLLLGGFSNDKLGKMLGQSRWASLFRCCTGQRHSV